MPCLIRALDNIQYGLFASLLQQCIKYGGMYLWIGDCWNSTQIMDATVIPATATTMNQSTTINSFGGGPILYDHDDYMPKYGFIM